jgi:FtsP/CotA-like multicopper oxidase with cupredoxin domain
MNLSLPNQALLGIILSSLTALAIAAPSLQIPNTSDGLLIQAPIIESINGVLSAKVDMVRAGLVGSSDPILYGNLPLYSNPIAATPGYLPDFPIPQFPLNYAAAYQFTLSDGTVLPAQFPGPTLKLKQGDTLKLEINNKLATPNSAPLPPQSSQLNDFAWL